MSTTVKAKPQTVSTGIYGSATTNKNGTTYNPSDFEKNLIGLTTTYIPQYIQQMVNPTYDSEIFKAQTEQRNRLANQSFENNLINPLVSRGLTRGSSINQMSNQFANKLADMEVDAMAQQDTANANVLNNLMNYYQMPYNMISPLTNLSNNLYMQEVNRAKNTTKGHAGIGSQIGGALGAGIGTAFGGPVGAYAGGAIGSGIGGIIGNNVK